MVVITLEKCPLALRGDLTKWLQEVSPGVYAGQVSARVRDKLWERVCSESRNGRATMVFSARNEQHLDFKVHNAPWEPIDFDGIKLMMRPSPSRVKTLGRKRKGFSRASKQLSASKHARHAKSENEPDEYVVIDLETTGLDANVDEIVEIGAIRYRKGQETERFQRFISIEGDLPPLIEQLTGISSSEIYDGVRVEDAVDNLLDFVGNAPLVAHNAQFDLDFLDSVLERMGEEELDNEIVDTLVLAKKKLPSAVSYGLSDLVSFYGLDYREAHRALSDCRITREVFVRLLDS